jgi:ABC-type antimicrobial peptide transport system permease subunit
MAFTSLGSAKTRSFLTMFGIVIGVGSVLIAISVGQGVQKQVIKQVGLLGNDVITILPGRSFTTNNSNAITSFNALASQGASTLTNKDVEDIAKLPTVDAVATNSYISGIASTIENPEYTKATIIAAPSSLQKILSSKLEYGEFYGAMDENRNTVVLGSNAANDLFNERDPIGRVLKIRGEEFIVRGVLALTPESPLGIPASYNTAIYMPLGTGNKLAKDDLEINQITVKLKNTKDIDATTSEINNILLTNHSNQKDYTVLQQDDFMQITDQIFKLITGLVAAIAGISLFVGGVGIMNIMLVSVSERTREIGIRKSVGATNRQIVSQFLVEAMVLSVIGGFFGVLLFFISAYFIKLYTPIIPAISLPIIGFAVLLSFLVGTVFGIAPAIKAARKDPISALRQL